MTCPEISINDYNYPNFVTTLEGKFRYSVYFNWHQHTTLLAMSLKLRKATCMKFGMKLVAKNYFTANCGTLVFAHCATENVVCMKLQIFYWVIIM